MREIRARAHARLSHRDVGQQPVQASLSHFHPDVAAGYGEKVLFLCQALAKGAPLEEIQGVLRSLIRGIVVRPCGYGFEIELFGEIANVLAFSNGAHEPDDQGVRGSVKLAAGEWFHPT
jgi:hypothetical protein